MSAGFAVFGRSFLRAWWRLGFIDSLVNMKILNRNLQALFGEYLAYTVHYDALIRFQYLGLRFSSIYVCIFHLYREALAERSKNRSRNRRFRAEQTTEK